MRKNVVMVMTNMLAQSPKLSPKEYLALEAESSVKYEYFDGEVFAMAGATDAHVTIAGNLFAELRLGRESNLLDCGS